MYQNLVYFEVTNATQRSYVYQQSQTCHDYFIEHLRSRGNNELRGARAARLDLSSC